MTWRNDRSLPRQSKYRAPEIIGILRKNKHMGITRYGKLIAEHLGAKGQINLSHLKKIAAENGIYF